MTQIALFLFGVFGLPWVIDLVWAPAPAQESVWDFLVTFLPVVWLPTILALVLIGFVEGIAALRKELRIRLIPTTEAVPWLLLAVTVPAVATLIAVFSGRWSGDSRAFMAVDGVLSMIAIQVVTGAVGEELGWRGFLLPRLGKYVGDPTGAWVMAILWSLWHLPAWFDPNLPHRMMPMGATLLSIAFFGVFMAFVFHRASESVLPTMLAHLSLNIMLGLGGVQFSSVAFWRTLAAILGIVAVLTTIALRIPPRAPARS